MSWLLGLVALGAVCAIWGIGIERHLYRVREAQIEDALPAGSEPIRVLHLSDIHLAPWQRRKARWVAGLTRLEPDLIINTGDNMSHLFAPSRIENGARLDTERFVGTLSERGWLNLNNRGGKLVVRGQRLAFMGLDDPHDGLDDLTTLVGQRADAAQSDLLIGVVHAPYLRILETLTLHDASLIFAGHTHGGQVCLPGKGALVTNCDLPTRHAKGLSGWKFGAKESMLNVCAGLGTSIFAPVRFFCLPEVRLITLLPKRG